MINNVEIFHFVPGTIKTIHHDMTINKKKKRIIFTAMLPSPISVPVEIWRVSLGRHNP